MPSVGLQVCGCRAKVADYGAQLWISSKVTIYGASHRWPVVGYGEGLDVIRASATKCRRLRCYLALRVTTHGAATR